MQTEYCPPPRRSTLLFPAVSVYEAHYLLFFKTWQFHTFRTAEGRLRATRSVTNPKHRWDPFYGQEAPWKPFIRRAGRREADVTRFERSHVSSLPHGQHQALGVRPRLHADLSLMHAGKGRAHSRVFFFVHVYFKLFIDRLFRQNFRFRFSCSA